MNIAVKRRQRSVGAPSASPLSGRSTAALVSGCVISYGTAA